MTWTHLNRNTPQPVKDPQILKNNYIFNIFGYTCTIKLSAFKSFNYLLRNK